jgi:hypothetical protein
MSIKGALSIIPNKIQGMLKYYTEDLEQAWANAGEDPLTISFGAKIGVVKGKNICEVSISFTKEKIKDSVTFEWSALQGKLFDQIEKMDTDLKKDGMTMEISSGGKAVTLGKESDLPDTDEKGYMKERIERAD